MTTPTTHTAHEHRHRTRPRPARLSSPGVQSVLALPNRLTSRHHDALFYVVAALIVAVVLAVAGLTDVLEDSAGRDEDPAAAAASSAPATTTRSASPWQRTPDPGESWNMVWEDDYGLNGGSGTTTYVNKTHMVAYTNSYKDRQLRGYDITGRAPVEIWSAPAQEEPVFLTSSTLVSASSLINPTTGEAAPAPWSSQELVALVTEDLIITCLRDSPTCTGWDLADGAVSLRWGPVDLPGSNTPEFLADANGNAANGYSKYLTVDQYAVALTGDKGDRRNSAAFVSLADGSVANTRPTQHNDEKITFIPAADGWLQSITHITRKPSEATVTSLTPDGSETESYEATQHRHTLLFAKSGLPTLAQYKSAFTQGDILWTAASLSCSTYRECRIHQQGTVMGVDDGTYSHLLHENGFVALNGEKYLILSYSLSVTPGSVLIIDRSRNSVVALNSGPHVALYGTQAHVTVAREDLLIASTTSGLAAYSPAQ